MDFRSASEFADASQHGADVELRIKVSAAESGDADIRTELYTRFGRGRRYRPPPANRVVEVRVFDILPRCRVRGEKCVQNDNTKKTFHGLLLLLGLFIRFSVGSTRF